MPLIGQAKTDYQREYMRKRRSNQRSNNTVRPEAVTVRPNIRPLIPKDDREIVPVGEYWDGQEARPEYEPTVDEPTKPSDGRLPGQSKPKPQSHNSMMIGYVPPKPKE